MTGVLTQFCLTFARKCVRGGGQGDQMTEVRSPFDFTQDSLHSDSSKSIALSPVLFALCYFCAVIFALCLSAGAQQEKKFPRIGFLSAAPSIDAAFFEGLRELGYIDNQNIFIEHRSAQGNLERLPGLAGQLVALKVDIIVTQGTPAAEAAKKATGSIPIVMATSGDPVGSGLVASLARPGGNITGLSLLNDAVVPKHLEMLKEAVPTISRVAWMASPAIVQSQDR